MTSALANLPQHAAHAEDGGDGKANHHANPQTGNADVEEVIASECRREADQPVADEGIDHRHARVMDAAQDAGGADLHAVADLEQGDEEEDAAGDGDDVRVGAVKRGDVVAEQEWDERHEDHDDGDDEHAAECALAQRGVVALAVGVAAADGERVGKAQRHHEGDTGVVERDLVGGGVDFISAADDEADHGKKPGFHDQRQRNRQANAEIATDGDHVGAGEALIRAIGAPARVAGNGSENEDGEDEIAERG